ncbi:MAG: type II secretion system protein GspM [Wenzhouxiangellaceae bacterium]|nr:type II secretion system protein GspM [Wenzhouxiangellaceae bacterium]
MKLLPDQSQSRPLAIGLLLVAVIVVYMVFFHWFIVRHVAVGDQIGRLEQQIGRFKASVEQRGPLQARLEALREDRMDSALFLSGSDFNIAAAELIRSLRDWVASHADDAQLCQVTNTSPRRANEPERFESVRVSVRMQCPLDDFVRILHEMESSVPLVFVDNLMINQRMTESQRDRRGGQQYGQLDIRFDMYGYLDQPGAEQ